MEIAEARRIQTVIGELLDVDLDRDLVLVLVENYDRLEEAIASAQVEADAETTRLEAEAAQAEGVDEEHPPKFVQPVQPTKVDVTIKKLPVKLLPPVIRGRFLVGMKRYME